MPRLEFKDNNVALMTKRSNIFLLSGLSTKTSFDSKTFSIYVENWTSKQIIRWIEGIGECVKPWIHLLESNILSGKHLLIVDDDYLSRIGIAQLGPRRVICQAIQLLIQNCTELRVENLQMLTMNVRIAAVTLAREMMTSQRLRETAHTRTQMVAILNEVSKTISNLDECAKKLIFWLDRSPFDSIQCYIDFRMRVLVIVLQVLRMINVPPKILFNSSSEIIKRAYELRDQCDWVIRECDDPLIISTSYIDKIVLRRHSSTTHWGLNLFSSYRGAHVISEIKIGSPADLCSQVDAGDEILMINDETVVGWDLSAVAERLGSGAERRTELTLVLRKMPNLDLPASTLLRERETPKPKAPRILTNLAPGSLISNFAIDEDDSKQLPEIEPRSPIKRRRSSTFKTVLQRFFKGGLQSSAQSASSHGSEPRRRATVCGGSPPPIRSNNNHHTHFDLLALLKPNSIHDGTRGVIRRARTMRHQPDGYVRSFVDNQLITQVDDDVMDDQLPFNTKCPTDFAKIDIVAPNELAQLGVTIPKISDPEWSAPIREETSTREMRYRTPLADSSLSAASLDSPSVRKAIDDSIWGWAQASGAILASPSTSSITSLHSPVATPSSRTHILSPFIFDGSGPPASDIPCTLLQGKTFEGWLRRRKTNDELLAAGSIQTNKWPKCWMALRAPFLYVYPNQFSKKADLVISVLRCAVTDATDLKTSKKFVFRIHRGPISHYFSCYTQNDMKTWMHKIIVAIEQHSLQPRPPIKSLSHVESGDADVDSGGGTPVSPCSEKIISYHEQQQHQSQPGSSSLLSPSPYTIPSPNTPSLLFSSPTNSPD